MRWWNKPCKHCTTEEGEELTKCTVCGDYYPEEELSAVHEICPECRAIIHSKFKVFVESCMLGDMDFAETRELLVDYLADNAEEVSDGKQKTDTDRRACA